MAPGAGNEIGPAPDHGIRRTEVGTLDGAIDWLTGSGAGDRCAYYIGFLAEARRDDQIAGAVGELMLVCEALGIVRLTRSRLWVYPHPTLYCAVRKAGRMPKELAEQTARPIAIRALMMMGEKPANKSLHRFLRHDMSLPPEEVDAILAELLRLGFVARASRNAPTRITDAGLKAMKVTL